MSKSPRQRRLGIALRAGTVAASVIAAAAIVLVQSQAAFTDSTDNTGNVVTAGTVSLSDDDSSSAMFDVSGMVPGDEEARCITLSYTGDVAADIKMYGAGASALDAYLDTTIEVGTGGSFADCSGFTASDTIYSGTLAGFLGGHTGWGDGVDVWSPAGAEDRTLRVSVTLVDDNGAQGLSATPTFTWEAQNG